jgi:dihydroorotate dehydrogenase
MSLATTYLGLKLKNPIMPGASPLVDHLDNIRRLEDAGASAIVMHSLFEEQITNDQLAEFAHTENPSESFSEATSYFPRMDDYVLGPDRYLDQISRIKEMVDIPVIGSLNGTTLGGWTDHARLIEAAGADALELNVYYIATDPDEPGTAVEQRTLDILQSVKESISIPVAVKLSPFFSSPGNFAKQLDALGAAGVILYNRFYQPDIDIEELEAIIAALLFGIAGRVIYERTHTRDLATLSGFDLWHSCPGAALGFILATAASMGISGFSGFLAEISVILGVWPVYPWAVLWVVLGIVITGAFSLRAMQKGLFAAKPASHGGSNPEVALSPLTWAEIVAMVILIGTTLAIGLYPKPWMFLIDDGLRSELFQSILSKP